MPDAEPIDLGALNPATTNGSPPVLGQTPPPFVEKYDPSQDREQAREDIAKRLIWCLIAIVAFALLASAMAARACWVSPSRCPATVAMLEPVSTILTFIFAPIVGLVGAATGFYFGEKSTR